MSIVPCRRLAKRLLLDIDIARIVALFSVLDKSWPKTVELIGHKSMKISDQIHSTYVPLVTLIVSVYRDLTQSFEVRI